MSKVLKTVAIIAVAVAIVVFAPAIAGVLASVAGSLGVTIAATAISSALIGMGISLALTAVASMFRKAPNMSQSLADRLNTSVAPTASRKIVFGTTGGGQDVRFFEGDVDLPNSKLDGYVQVIALASHRISAFREFYTENDLVWSNGSFLKHRSGFAPDNPFRVVLEGKPGNGFSVGSGRYWNSSATFTGCAYYVPFWKLDDKVWESGIPQRLTAIVDGCPLYDPRRDSTRGGSGSHRIDNQETWGFRDGSVEYGRNPALALLTYLIGWRINGKLVWGMGVPAHRIDFDNFRTYANVCEERVATQGGGTVQRYTNDGIFSTTDSHETIINGITAAMGSCKLTDRGGTYCLVGGYDDTAGPKIDFTADDLVAPANGASPYLWNPAPPSRERFNIVRGRFANPEELYQLTDWGDPIEQPALADNIPRTLTLDLGTVSRAETCQRIAKQFLLREYKCPGKFSATFGPKAFAVEIGSVITLSLPAEGWNKKLFRVEEQAESHDMFFQMVLREEDPAIYAWDREEKALPASIRPQGYDASTTITPTDLALTSASYSGANGVNVSEVHVTWTPEMSGRVNGIQIQSRPQGATAWTEQAALFDPKAGTFTFTSNAPGITVEVQARFRMSSAVYSPWATANVSTAAVEVVDNTARETSDEAKTVAEQADRKAGSAIVTADLADGKATQAVDALKDATGNIVPVANLKADIAGLKDTYGSTANANAAKAAAEAARDAAKVSETNSQQANEQSQAARDAANQAVLEASKQSDLAAQAENKARQSASAAQGSATIASSKAGEAVAAAGNAAVSERNAQGSANSAASSQALTASTYSKVITATGNEQFDNGPDGWLGFPAGVTFAATSYGRSGVIRTPAGAKINTIQGRKVPVTGADQRFLLRVSLRCTAATSQYYIGAIFYDANDNLVGASDGTGNYPLGPHFTLDSAIHGWIDREIIIGRGVFEPSPYGGTRNIPEGTAYFRPCVFVNYQETPGSVTELDYFTVADVTMEQKAASSADAASKSASTASAKESEATQSASAASVSAESARTKAGEALASQKAAALSESNAKGSENSASSSAQVAASSRDSSIGAAASLLPDSLADKAFWRYNYSGDEKRPNDFDGRFVFTATSLMGYGNAANGILDASHLGVTKLVPGRKHRITATWRIIFSAGIPRVRAALYAIGCNEARNALYTPGAGFSIVPSQAGWGDAAGFAIHSLDVADDDLIAYGCQFLRGLFRFWDDPGGQNFELVSLKITDVTSELLAAGSASSAAGSASTAVTKADEAGRSAAAANQSKVDAAAENAAARGSAQAASASAASASSQAAAATAAQKLSAAFSASRGLTPNGSFESGPEGWSVSSNMVYGENWYRGPGFRVSNDYGSLGSSKPIRVDTSRKYRINCEVTNHGANAATVYAGFTCLDANKQFLGNIYMPGYIFNGTPKAPPGGVYPASNEISGTDFNAPTYTHGYSFVKGTVYVQLLALLNYPEPQPTTATLDISYLYLEDITQEKAAEAQASIATAQAAVSSASASSAQASSTLAASMASALANRGSTFSSWPATRAIPEYWGWWGDASNTKIDGLIGRYGYHQFAAANAAETGLYCDTTTDPGLAGMAAGTYVVDAEVSLTSGSFPGSGVLFRGLDDNGNITLDCYNNFAQMPSDQVPFGATGNGVPGQRYRFTQVATMPANTTRVMIFLMTQWAGFGARSEKGIDWHKCGVRRATQAENQSGKVAGLEARVSTNEGAIAAANGKLTAWSEKTVSAGAGQAAIRMMATDVNGNATSNIILSAGQIALINADTGTNAAGGLYVSGGQVIVDGTLTARSGIYVGNSKLPIQIAAFDRAVSDGTVVSFGYDLGRIPSVTFGPCPVTLTTDEVYAPYAENLTSTGFTARLIIKGQPVSASQSTGAFGNNGDGSWQASTSGKPKAGNGQYTVNISVSAQAYAYNSGTNPYN